MPNQTIYAILKTILILCSISTCGTGKELQGLMTLKFSKEIFEFGDSIPAEIIFVNTSSDVLVLKENPQKSIDLVMHAVDLKTAEDLNYSIGKPEVSRFGDDKFALAVPIKEKFEIQPKSLFSFVSDLNSRLYLTPGRYDCFLVNYLVEKSNKTTLMISFSPGSVSYLLKTSVDEREGYGKREWAYDWLKKINPQFELHLTMDGDSNDQRKTKTAFNERSYAQFRKWWEENQKTEAMVKRIQQLNP
jgi:hypothetical protein